MKQVLSVLAALCLLAGAASAATLVDKFDSYQDGAVETVTTAWKGGNSIIQVDPANAGNKILRGIQQGGQSSTYGILSPEASIAEGQTKTLFFRIRANSATTDTAIGLTDVDAPNTADGQWGIFGPEIRILNGRVGIRHANTWYDALPAATATLNVGETQPWYNVWMVVTNAVGASQATDVFRVYLHQNGDDPATEANRLTVNNGTVNVFGFRVAIAGTLDRFLWGRQGGGDATDIRRVWIDDMYVMDGIDLSNPATQVFGAHDPSPVNGATGVAVDAALSWNTGLDPNNLEQINPAITKHYVYFRATDADFTKPQTTKTLIDVNGATGSYSPTGMVPDTTYYWRVDEILNNGSPTDANFVIAGAVWSFASIKSAPIIAGQPTMALVEDLSDATFTVNFSSYSDATAVWYKVVDGVNDLVLAAGSKYAMVTDKKTTATLTVIDATIADQGYYYCKLTSPGGTDTSVQAALAIKRFMAHWTLDGLVNGKYADARGNYPAEPNGVPQFVGGANPAVTDQGVQIDTVNGYASAGTWNPSAFSNQFTISLWANWAGQTTPTTWQGLISKEVSYGADTMMWQYEVTSAAEASSTVVLKNGLETGNLSSPVLPIGSWAHEAITWDGTTARIYRDGIEVASGAWQPGTKTDAPVNIGISARSLTTNLMFHGALDDVRIYNYAFDKYGVADLFYGVQQTGVCIEPSLYDAAYDLNENCKIDLGDFAILASEWLKCGRYPVEMCQD